jgi:hypothetical protein
VLVALEAAHDLVVHGLETRGAAIVFPVLSEIFKIKQEQTGSLRSFSSILKMILKSLGRLVILKIK